MRLQDTPLQKTYSALRLEKGCQETTGSSATPKIASTDTKSDTWWRAACLEHSAEYNRVLQQWLWPKKNTAYRPAKSQRNYWGASESQRRDNPEQSSQRQSKGA